MREVDGEENGELVSNTDYVDPSMEFKKRKASKAHILVLTLVLGMCSFNHKMAHRDRHTYSNAIISVMK